MAKIIGTQIEKLKIRDEKLAQSLSAIYILSALIHVAYLILFYKNGVIEMQVFNYFSPLIFIVCLILNTKGKISIAAFLGLSEATIHGISSTYLVGWSSGFYYFLILGYLLIFFFSALKFIAKLSLASGLTAIFILLYLVSHSQEPKYQLDAELIQYLHIANLVTTVIVISIFSFLYTKLIRKIEDDLKESLNQMSETQKTLYDQIEENKQIQAELEKGNALLNAMMEHLPDYVYFKDLDSKFIRVSKSMKKLTSSGNSDELIGKSDFDIHRIEAALEFKHDEEEIIRTKNGFANRLVYETLPNGLIQWVTTTKMPLLDKNGNCMGTFGLTRDVTYLKKLEIEAKEQAQMLKLREEELEKKEEEQRLLNEQKIKFFSIFSHDLKNPLNAMQGFTMLLWENYEKYDDAKKYKMLSEIVKLMNIFKGMISNLLDWSRSQLDTISVRPVDLVLKSQITEIIGLYKIQQNQKQISVDIDIDENLLFRTDEQILQTVVRNIFSNALKYTHPGGTIKIKTTTQGSLLKIDIIDNGIGMSVNEIKNLFSLKGESSKIGTLNEKGTGLGLVVCQEYLARINGRIEVDSVVDKGSVFSIIIPMIKSS